MKRLLIGISLLNSLHAAQETYSASQSQQLKSIATINDSERGFTKVIFSKNGAQLASRSFPNHITFYSDKGVKTDPTILCRRAYDTFAFNHNQGITDFLVGTKDKGIEIYDSTTGTLKKRLNSPDKQPIIALAFSPSGN